MITDRRAATTIGRHARLELTFSLRGGRTVLSHAYAEPPFRLGRVFDVDGAAYLIIVCAAPGVFAGDRLRQTVRVERGARVLLASQSALQVHPSDADAPAEIEHVYHVEGDAELHCCWDPVIPFSGARLAQRFDLRLAADARAYWSDALMAGRCSRGEAWQFQELRHELRVSVGGALKYLERYRLAPGDADPRRQWVVGEAAYTGTTVVRHDRATVPFAEGLHEALVHDGGTRSAVDVVEPGLIVGRTLAQDGPAFARARATIRDRALADVYDSPLLIVRR